MNLAGRVDSVCGGGMGVEGIVFVVVQCDGGLGGDGDGDAGNDKKGEDEL